MEIFCMKIFRISPHVFLTFFVLGVMGTVPATFAGEDQVKRLSEPVAVTESHEVFGAVLPESGTLLSLGDLIEGSDKYQDQEVLLETRIAKVCQKKGCFFIAQDGSRTARVSFKDYEFFIPTDAGGKEVVLLGTFSRKNVTREEAEHYAKDLGETAVSSPESFQYSIVASAVKIPRG